MPRIVLFFPKLGEGQLIQPPMSLLFVASFLLKDGFEVRVIDQRFCHNWQNELLAELRKEPLMVGFSTLTGRQILYALEASRLVEENSQAKVVWGGVHVSLLPEQTLENKDIDFVVIGEGEETFLNLARKLTNGEVDFKKIKGLGFKRGREVIINEPAEFINLDESPAIPYKLIEVGRYIAGKSFASGKRAMPAGRQAKNFVLYTSRGCPHRCAFCYNLEFNKKRWRGKSASRVMEEMEYLIENFGINAFEIEDDEFFVDLGRAREIAEAIVRKGWKIELFSSCRVNYVMRMTDDYLKLLYEAGFKTLAFGVESGSLRIQQMIHKDITNEQVLEAIKKLKKAGINSKYYFMCGFPAETIKDLYQTTDLIWQMKNIDRQIRIPAWRVFTPYPGTELYGQSISAGFKPPTKLEQWAIYDFETVNMPWVNRRVARIIKNVAFMLQFIKLDDNGSKNPKYRLSRWWGRWLDWRWQHHWFSFLPEKYIIKLISKNTRI